MRKTKPVLICCSVLVLACTIAPGAPTWTPSPVPVVPATASVQAPTETLIPIPTPVRREQITVAQGFRTECQEYIDPILDTMQKLNLPMSPLPDPDTSAVFQPTATPPPVYPTREFTAQRIGETTESDAEAIRAGEYLSQHGEEGVDGLRQWLIDQNLICPATTCPNDVLAANLDQDDTPEYVVSIPRLINGVSACTYPEIQDTWVYVLDCQFSSSHFCNIFRLDRGREQSEMNRCIEGVTDINADHKLDILISGYHCGASDCFDTLDIVNWDAGSYRFIDPEFSAHNGCVMGRQQPGTDQLEFYVNNSSAPGALGFQVGIYLDPHEVTNYQWDGQQYILVNTAFDIHCQPDIIRSGLKWAAQGKFETAIRFLSNALTIETFPSAPWAHCGDPSDTLNKTYPWPAYAQFSIGVLQARLDRANEARAALNAVSALDEQDVIAPAADVYLRAYTNGTYLSACNALSEYLATLGDRPPLRGPFENDPLPTMCPFDIR